MNSRKELEQEVGRIAQALRAAMPAGIGFSLFLFDYGQEGSIAYASTAKRADMIKAVREWLRKVEHS